VNDFKSHSPASGCELGQQTVAEAYRRLRKMAAAQRRGEVATAGQYERANVGNNNVCPATAADLGLRRDQIFEVWIAGRGLDRRGGGFRIGPAAALRRLGWSTTPAGARRSSAGFWQRQAARTLQRQAFYSTGNVHRGGGRSKSR